MSFYTLIRIRYISVKFLEYCTVCVYMTFISFQILHVNFKKKIKLFEYIWNTLKCTFIILIFLQKSNYINKKASKQGWQEYTEVDTPL